MTYSSSLAMSRQRLAASAPRSSSRGGFGRGQNTTSFRAVENTLGPISNTIMLIVLVCLLGLLYLTQVTKTNAYSYRINELETTSERLKSEQTELEIASARLQALERIKNSPQAQGLVSQAPTATIQD